MRMHHRRPVPVRRGFTILELMIVIGILLAIGGLVAVNLLGASESADLKLTRAQLQTFEKALGEFRIEMKRYPSEEEGLAVLWSKDALADEDDKARYTRTYLTEPKPKDTWGHEDDISNHDQRKEAAGDEFSEFSGMGSSSGG
jgi:general secretion pathway protein G